MEALLLGGAGVAVETARLERLAYNAAFEQLGLDLYWNVATYCKLLEIPGGPRRLESVFGEDWLSGLTDEVFALQELHFQRLARKGLKLRPGVAEVIEFCKKQGVRLGWVTTATPQKIDTLIACTHGLDRDDFELLFTRLDTPADKPDPAIYNLALDTLRLDASDVIAIEDSPINQAAALAADLQCYLYPGEYAAADHHVLVTRQLPETVDWAHTLWSAHSVEGRLPSQG